MSSAPGPLARPAGAQGPGPLPGSLVEALDLVLARRAAGALPGERRAAGLGTGTELAQIRPYQVGDDVRRLDAAASARTGIPHVREHVPERALTTWLLLDVSASMAFGTAARLKSDVAAGVAEVVGRLAVRRAGRVALLTCGAPVQRLLPPRGGRNALVALRRAVAAGVAPDGAPPPDDALALGLRRVMRLARGPGLVVVVSDFREPGAGAGARVQGALGTGARVEGALGAGDRPPGARVEGALGAGDRPPGARVEGALGAGDRPRGARVEGALGAGDRPPGARAQGPRPAWTRALSALSGRHDVLAVEVADPREAELPDAGQLALVDPETGARLEIDTASAELRRAFASAELARRDELKAALRRARARHVTLSTDGDWLRALGRSLR